MDLKKHIRKLSIVGTACFAVSTLNGCATIMTGTDQPLTVMTEKEVTGARCKLTDKKGKTWYVASSPGTITVKRGDGPMTITCEKENFKPVTIQVDETMKTAVLGNVIFGGLIGIVVDVVSGAAQEYPDKVVVWMEPEEWNSEEERVSWLAEKEAYESEMKKSKSGSSDETQAAEFDS